MSSLKGKAVLLTGASGAIGGEVAQQLAAKGASLAITGRRERALSSLAEQVEAASGALPAVIPADLSARGEAARLADRAVQALGPIDVLVNNAGGSLQALTWVAGDRDEARTVLETNLWSPLALAAALIPAMIERGAGVVVNVGSMARVSPFPHLGHYAASRSALSVATQVLQMEVGSRGVRVVEVALGPVDTPASQENRTLPGADRWLDGRPGLGHAGAAAGAIVAAAESDAEGIVHYPRILRWPERLPGLGRRHSRRAAAGADLTDERVRVAGR